MGSSVSQAVATAPPPAYTPLPPYPAPPSKPQEEEKAAEEEKVDYMNLPCPVPYEEIQREAFMALKPELFEGLCFDFTKALNPYFALSHRGAEVIKVPTSSYDFGNILED